MDDTLANEYDDAIATLYDETFSFLSTVETVMHIIPEKKEATKEKLEEIEEMIAKLKKYNSRFLKYVFQVIIK